MSALGQKRSSWLSGSVRLKGHAALVGRVPCEDVGPHNGLGGTRSVDSELVDESAFAEVGAVSATSGTTLSRPAAFASYIAASARASIEANDKSCGLSEATPKLAVGLI
jgi:hypothetical protein